tara:strand:- start:65 stop:991 length:927 start_codon:yes stop_codon:yes gene_type:complete
MEENILPVEAIQERDVDLILLEEFATDNSFCKWFINELDLPKIYENLGVWRSITGYGLGETDVLFSYKSENERIYILIENKLDASFQDKQYERYLQRAENYVTDNSCDSAFTILVAPKLYCDNQSEFESYISYEQISKRLEFTGTKRNLFKSNLLKIASEKLRRGYQPVNSEPVQKFWYSYWKFKDGKYPNLRMKKPDIVPQNSDWPMLYDDNLKGIVFYHKLGQGNTDATFKNFSNDTEFKIREILPEKYELVKHSKSFSIRIFSGKIERTMDFDNQKEIVNKGLENLEELRFWLNENKENWLQHGI